MIQHYTDIRSNRPDQIADFAKAVGRGKDRIAVFEYIHKGKKRFKSVSEIAKGTGLSRKRVLEEGKRLVHNLGLVQTKKDGELGYERDQLGYTHREKIIALAKSPKKLEAFPTKVNPRGGAAMVKVTAIRAPKALIRTSIITVDHIEQFSKAKKVKSAPAKLTLAEKRFKGGVKKLLGETGTFNDWGGEMSDLHTTRPRVNGTRHTAAFAFKGPGVTGILTPARLGKNGDQIQRLFNEDADIYMVQYGEQIAPSVLVQLAAFAQAKSLTTGRKIYYGVIDGADSARLVAAYPNAFK
jgi:hypothetical protein